MLDSDKIFALLGTLGKDKGQFKKLLEKYIRSMINLVSTVEELREEIMDFDFTYQMCIEDVGVLYWLRINKGVIDFGFGNAEEAKLIIKTTRDMFVKMATREISGIDAYMKGIIKAEGSLTHALRFIKFLRLLYRYLGAVQDKKK
ncbi:MAG: SCP2 sterol-binding domain-containing protein [Promethearchaeota archaeon]